MEAVFELSRCLSVFEVGEWDEDRFVRDFLLKDPSTAVRWLVMCARAVRVVGNPRLRHAFLLAAERDPGFSNRLLEALMHIIRTGKPSIPIAMTRTQTTSPASR